MKLTKLPFLFSFLFVIILTGKFYAHSQSEVTESPHMTSHSTQNSKPHLLPSLTLWYKILLGMLMLAHRLSENSWPFMEAAGSLPWSQQPAMGCNISQLDSAYIPPRKISYKIWCLSFSSSTRPDGSSDIRGSIWWPQKNNSSQTNNRNVHLATKRRL
jgi:hypothetical protein